jgi:single-stranded DNA-specific DHH superfamily exonuclease
MLTKKQVKEIRGHLERAQNPLFFFDNDPDGLCSYLLLRRFIGRGKAVPVKLNPLSVEYFRRVREFSPDYIFVLDVPEITSEFLDEVEKLNLPVVWIDHHGLMQDLPNFVNYYDPVLNKKSSSEPVTALCYQIVGNKEESWLGSIGCISDKFIPDFYKYFLKKYPELGKKTDLPFEIFFETDLGKICRILWNGLKDRTTNVMKMIRFLVNVKSPHEILEETRETSAMHERFKELEEKEISLFEKAKKGYDGGKVFFFKYGGETSMSAALANRISHYFLGKIIVIAHSKGIRLNLSIRGKKVREKFMPIISKMENARGGGHEESIGAQFDEKDWEFFKKEVRKVYS